jgi:hypothetical protein
MKTEAQAEKTLCCLHVGPNRDTSPLCAAADCMAWRWGQEKSERGGTTRATVKTDVTWSCAMCDGNGKHQAYVTDENPDGWCPECEGEGHGFKFAYLGFCGLAGVPV